MIRITRSQHGSDVTVQVAGRLKAEHVVELEAQCEAPEGSLALDLSELQSADHAGIRWLFAAAERGALLRGVSPYIDILLKTQAEKKTEEKP